MQNEVQIFQFDGNKVRTVIGTDGEPWWVAADVCDVLGIINSRDAVSRLDEDEKDDVGIADAIGRVQQTNVINEPGVYSLIMVSRKPEARRFKRWLHHEVIPAIRKTGSYTAAPGPVSTGSAIVLIGQTLIEQERRIVAVEKTTEDIKDRIDDQDAAIHETAARLGVIEASRPRVRKPTNKELRKRVRDFLSHSSLAVFSNNRIAKFLEVSAPFVAKIRAEMMVKGTIGRHDVRRDVNDRRVNVLNLGRNQGTNGVPTCE